MKPKKQKKRKNQKNKKFKKFLNFTIKIATQFAMIKLQA